jgi:hypothetical protein
MGPRRRQKKAAWKEEEKAGTLLEVQLASLLCGVASWWKMTTLAATSGCRVCCRSRFQCLEKRHERFYEAKSN